MTTKNKIKVIVIFLFIIIISIIIARHFVGLHFKKKFSVRPAPGVIVQLVESSIFNKTIETFGTALAKNSKTYRIKKDQIVGNFNIDGRFVKKGEIIAALKDAKNIIADFDGKLGKREIAQGVLGTDSLIITLDDLKKMVIDIKVPENYASILKKGLRVEILSSSGKKYNGKTESISSRIDPSTRSILARVIVDNQKYEIIPGQLMTVKVIYDETRHLSVPESAVIIQGKTAFIYVVKNDLAVKTDIVIGKRNFGKVSVLSGISKGDTVISEGISKVRNNLKVKILNN